MSRTAERKGNRRREKRRKKEQARSRRPAPREEAPADRERERGAEELHPIIYLDTNVYNALVHERDIRARLSRLVMDLGGAGIGLSETNILELQGASRIHHDLVELLKFYPTALLKRAAVLLDEEVAAYPEERTGEIHTAVFFDPARETEEHPLLSVLRDGRIEAAAEEMRRQAKDAPARHAALRDNFPPAASGKYDRRQAHEFADLLAFQWLAGSHPEFAEEIVEARTMETSAFKTIRMHAYLVFWRFYLNRRTPNAKSDLGDQAHARFYPYCRAVVVENDAAETLRQIKKHSDLLEGVDIMSLRDLRAYDSG